VLLLAIHRTFPFTLTGLPAHRKPTVAVLAFSSTLISHDICEPVFFYYEDDAVRKAL
jgi:hypothetical protein